QRGKADTLAPGCCSLAWQLESPPALRPGRPHPRSLARLLRSRRGPATLPAQGTRPARPARPAGQHTRQGAEGGRGDLKLLRSCWLANAGLQSQITSEIAGAPRKYGIPRRPRERPGRGERPRGSRCRGGGWGGRPDGAAAEPRERRPLASPRRSGGVRAACGRPRPRRRQAEGTGAGGGRSPGPVRRRQARELRSRPVPAPYKGGRRRQRLAQPESEPKPEPEPGRGPARSGGRLDGGTGTGTGTGTDTGRGTGSDRMGGGGPRRPGALPLLALALLAAQGGAAPLQPGGSPALTKIYPRGSHWAVGHLMGKKSTGDFPYGYEEENKIPFSALPENIKQLDDSLQWEEMSKYLLRLLEGNENKSAHFSKGGLPWYTRNTWETDDNSSWKDMMEYLLQVVNTKENTPS
uniref:Gastrin-releasing peptide n=3 Tax=Anatidae TaxID=8830 RepID=A0A493TXR3_ANAPP